MIEGLTRTNRARKDLFVVVESLTQTNQARKEFICRGREPYSDKSSRKRICKSW